MSWIWSGPGDHRLELTYQASFPSAQAVPGKNPLTSISAKAVPDYVLAVWAGDVLVSWIILDAKYRSGRQSIHDGLGDIHRYRDGLRISGKPALAAYIVVPHLQPDVVLYGDASYLASNLFGALSLYEKRWIQPVLDWLVSSVGPTHRPTCSGSAPNLRPSP